MPAPDDGRCTAKAKSTGNRCGNWAVSGARVCRIHGGKIPAVRKAAARRVAQDKLTRQAQADAAAVLAHEGLRAVDDPVEELGKLAAEVIAFKDALGQRVQALKAIRYSAAGTGTEQLRTELALLERAQDRSMKVLEVLSRLNLDERRVARLERTDRVLSAFLHAVGLAGDPAAEDALLRVLADDEDERMRRLGGQRQQRLDDEAVELVHRAVTATLDALGLSTRQRAAVPRVLPVALRALASGEPFVPPVRLGVDGVDGAEQPQQATGGRSGDGEAAASPWSEARARSVLEWLLAGVGVPVSDPVARAQAAVAARVLVSGSGLPAVVSPSRAWWLGALARAEDAVRRLGEAPALSASSEGEGRRVLEGLVLEGGGGSRG